MSSSIRRALKRFDEDLGGFSAQLGQEIHELKRNVTTQPVTGPTYFRHCLEDLNERLGAIGEEVAALEGVSLDAVSLEELVGHCMALYQANHRGIERLELQLQKYGYADLFAPLPPENPLDMLELQRARARPRPSAADSLRALGLTEEDGEGCGGAEGGRMEEAEGAGGAGVADPTAWDDSEDEAAAHLGGGGAEAEAGVMEELTNQMGAAALGAGASQHQAPPRTVGRPRTTMKAMAPLTAVKALMRNDTPSSMASPEGLSPGMRELLGKYATSDSSGAPSLPASAARLRRPSGLGAGAASAGAPPSPAPAYLSPAFQLAAMEQELQMVHSEAEGQHLGLEQQAGTPLAADGGAGALAHALGDHCGAGGAGTAAADPGQQQPDMEVYTAMKHTAQKLADKPSFLEQYRQKFPHIVASTERLLDTVQKSRPGGAGTGIRGAPSSAAVLAARAARSELEAARATAPSEQQAQQHLWAPAAEPAAVDEDNTLELRAQLLGAASSRSIGLAPDATDELSRAAAAAGSVTSFHTTAAAPVPSTVRSAAAPPPIVPHPPAVATTTAAAPTPGATPLPGVVPPLRPVVAAEYEVLPSFIRGQLPLEALNERLGQLHTLLEARVAAGGAACFLMADVDALGLGSRGKTLVNSLVKLGRAQLRVQFGGGGAPGGTTYLLL